MIPSSALNPLQTVRTASTPAPAAVPGLGARTPPRPPSSSAYEPSAAQSQTIVLLVTASVVAMLTLLAISQARSTDLIVALWAANAVAAAVWLRTGRGGVFDLSFGAMIAVGVMAGEILAGNTLAQSLMFTTANMIEIVAAVFLARRFAPNLDFSTVWNATRVVATTALVAPIPAAAFAAVAMVLMRDVPISTTFQTWWFGHALGMLVLIPALVAVSRGSLAILRQPLRVLEWLGLIGLLVGLCYLIYFRAGSTAGYLLNPVLILVAVRLRAAGVGVGMLIVATFMVGGMLQPEQAAAFAQRDVSRDAHVMNSQLMLVFAGLPFLLVAALLNERDVLSAVARAGQHEAERATAAKSRLLANVAHEIKSPVAGVIGIGDLWSSGQLGPTTPQQREMAEMLVRTARQVEALAHDLLDVARAESGAVKVELRPTDLCGVIEDVRRTTALRPEARALDLQVAFAEPHLVAIADSQRITQVIDNLATNAVKYGAAGGIIRFAASRIDDRIRIEVIDKGKGLSEAKQVELFEPFNRLGLERSTVEGHGIGLALSKRLVELQAGAIGVISAPGQGATFWVELPAA